MQKASNNKYEKRNQLLKFCMDKGMPHAMILKTVRPMEGKTPEEKEKIAERLIQKLQSENGASMTSR